MGGCPQLSRYSRSTPSGRRRPDPLVVVTAQLREWFEAEPWRTARELQWDRHWRNLRWRGPEHELMRLVPTPDLEPTLQRPQRSSDFRMNSPESTRRTRPCGGSWSSSSAIWLRPHRSGQAAFPHPALPGSNPHHAARGVHGWVIRGLGKGKPFVTVSNQSQPIRRFFWLRRLRQLSQIRRTSCRNPCRERQLCGRPK